MVGNYTQTAASISGADAGNYSFAGFTTPSSNYSINKLALTGTSIAAGSSTYGAGLNPGVVGFTNVITGDNVSGIANVNTSTLSSSNNPIVGSYTQTAASLSGADAGNYSLTSFTTPSSNYSINKLTLTGTSIASSSSTYGATLNPGAVSFTNALAGDSIGSTANVNTSTVSSSNNPIVGNYTQTATSISGTDAGNYSFAGFTTPSSNYSINKLALTDTSGITADNKLFNGNTTATLSFTNVQLQGEIPGDNVSITTANYVANFVTANVGNNIPVTVSNLGLSGTDAINYALTQPTGLAADILPVPVPPPSPPSPSPTPTIDLSNISINSSQAFFTQQLTSYIYSTDDNYWPNITNGELIDNNIEITPQLEYLHHSKLAHTHLSADGNIIIGH